MKIRKKLLNVCLTGVLVCSSTFISVGFADEEVDLVPAEEAGWELFFEDDFDRDELGDDWEVVDGNWKVEEGYLRGSGCLISSRGFPGEDPPGFQRLEFEARTDVQPIMLIPGMTPEVSVGDLSSIIHAQSPEEAEGSIWGSGYFFQFGGFHNTRNRIARKDNNLVDDRDTEHVIEPDEMHHIVVENDEGTLRMYVDGKLLYEYEERFSLMGVGQDRVGFYFYTAGQIHNVKVYLKRLPSDLDLDL